MKRGFETNKQFIRERFVSFVSSKFIHQCTTGTLLKQTVQSPLNARQFDSLPHNLFVCQSRSFVNWHPFGRKRDRLLGNFFRFKVIPEITPTGQPAKKPNIKHFLESLKVIRIVPEIKISKSARNGLLWFVGSATICWWLYRRYWAPKESRFRRKLHTLVTVAVILADYKYSLRREEHGTESYQLRLSEAHKRAASRLLALADANGGVYTKAGQFITSLNGIPIEYRQKLCKLEDQAESRPFKEIKSVILSEFSGKSLEDLFLYIEEVPIAAASLAQVHRGITRKGEPIAVKVQYPLTEKCFYSDLDNMSLSSRIVRFVFPQLDLDWIVKKFTAEIAKELDFEQEARNSQQLAKYFQGKPTIKVPFVYSHLSSKRVLTMELIEGVKITDVAQLKALGISPRKVVRSLYEIFGEMIFCHGFFHADPHPGNIMVQKREGPINFRIVLLDHGLYRRLSPQFRQDFCELWKSLIPFNEARLFQISKRLGIHSHYQYFPLLISRNYWRSLKLVSLKELASLEVFNLVENVSEDMMLIIKSFVHLNYIASDLGVNAVEIARVLAKYAFKGDTLYAGWEEGRRSNLFVGYCKFYFQYIRFKSCVLQSVIVDFFTSLFQRILCIEIL